MKNLKKCCRCGATVDTLGKIFRRRRPAVIFDKKTRRACPFCAKCARFHPSECRAIAARLFKQLQEAA